EQKTHSAIAPSLFSLSSSPPFFPSPFSSPFSFLPSLPFSFLLFLPFPPPSSPFPSFPFSSPLLSPSPPSSFPFSFSFPSPFPSLLL
ncbi:hypothetical protein ACXWR7_11125, partial [Streptococcus pyogenes]